LILNGRMIRILCERWDDCHPLADLLSWPLKTNGRKEEVSDVVWIENILCWVVVVMLCRRVLVSMFVRIKLA